MFKKYLSSKKNLFEGSIIIFAFIWYLLNKNQKQLVSLEFIINLTFLMFLITLVIFRSCSFRHMYFGFLLLILAVIGNVFGYQQFVYFVSSLALSLFILGVINMHLLWKKH